MDGAHATTGQAGGLVRIEWSAPDRMRALTVIGLFGLLVAVAMAVFGLPSIDFHGPLHRMNVMDPLCGGTRAARLTAQGNLSEAWRYNPLGIVATLGAAFVVLRLAMGLTVGRWLTLRFAWTPRRIRVALAVLAVATVLLEIRQQGRADLLTRHY